MRDCTCVTSAFFSVSLSSLKQAFAQNYIHSDSESGEFSSSSDGIVTIFPTNQVAKTHLKRRRMTNLLRDLRAGRKKFCAKKRRTVNAGGE